MSYAIFQSAALGLILLWSAGFAFRRLFPRRFRILQTRIAQRLGASPNAALRALGAKLTPPRTARAGCGGGCSSCGGCALSAAAKNEIPSRAKR